jgi:signal peptidase
MEITPQPEPRKGRAGRLLFNLGCTLVSLVAVGFILPAAFGLERYVIAGGSMTGSIGRGSVVFEEVVPVSDLEVGDVITYMPPAESEIPNLVTHRIVSIKGTTFRTKGDANPEADPWVFELTAATQPRAVAHVPYVGYAIIALQDPTTRMAVIGVPASLVVLFSFRELVGALRRRKGEPAPENAGGVEDLELEFAAAAAAPVVLIPVQPDAAAAGAPRHASHRPLRAGTLSDPDKLEV